MLEQFLAELGNALLEFVDGTHCTILDPRKHSDDPRALRAKARSLVARFEKLGRDRGTIMVAIPATEAGIAAAASLQCEDGIGVNLTSVSGVMHAAACAQAGAAAVTIPVATVCFCFFFVYAPKFHIACVCAPCANHPPFAC